MTLAYESDRLFIDLPEWEHDRVLMQTLEDCIQSQWQIGRQHAEMVRESTNSDAYVSEEALRQILESGEDISDIRTHQELSNCIVFHTRNLDGSLVNDHVIARRKEADSLVAQKIRNLFEPGLRLDIEMSGHFWYPKGGYMGWHTNLRKPGWRMYVNYAADEKKSFFRYRDPLTDTVITAWDKHWNFRLFKISPQFPFWHCVQSETDRFSLGYRITLM